MAYPELKYLSINTSMYQFQDIGARELIAQLETAGLVTKISTDAASTPQGVQWKSGTTTITGTWVADAGSLKYLVLVPDNLDETAGNYIEYVTVQIGSGSTATYSWEKIGTTQTDLSDYTKKEQFTVGHVTIPNATAHRHLLPNLTASFTPAGTIGSFGYTATNATVNRAASAATVTGVNYTPEGTITPTNTKTAISDLAFNSSAAANVTGASYTPAGTITITQSAVNATLTFNSSAAATVTGAAYTPAGSVNITDGGHGHTLTSSTASATGKIQYVYGAAFTQNTPTAVTSSTFSSVAYNVSVNGEVLVMSTATMKPISAVTAGTKATWTASTAWLGASNHTTGITAAFAGTSATITPTVKYSLLTAASYSKVSSATFAGTAATITPTVTYSLITGASYSKLTAASFTGSSATITPGVSYQYVNTVSYDKLTGASFTGTAGSPTVTYSTAFSTASTSTAVGGAASGTYSVLDSNGGNAGVLSATYVPA